MSSFPSHICEVFDFTHIPGYVSKLNLNLMAHIPKRIRWPSSLGQEFKCKPNQWRPTVVTICLFTGLDEKRKVVQPSPIVNGQVSPSQKQPS